MEVGSAYPASVVDQGLKTASVTKSYARNSTAQRKHPLMSKTNLGATNQPAALANIYSAVRRPGLATGVAGGSGYIRKAEVVDLACQRAQIGDLAPCNSLDGIADKRKTLFVDLSACGKPLPLEDCNCVHLSFPSTLLRRPKFQFVQLARTLDQDSQNTLAVQIQKCDTFVFYDDASTMHECSIHTYQALTKIIPYLEDRKNFHPRYFLLQLKNDSGGPSRSGINEPVSTSLKRDGIESKPEKRPVLNQKPCGAKNKLKVNLKITIPCRNSKNDNSNTMFVQSLKKDSIHYSPDSLRKYFTFHIPDELTIDNSVLPQWLKPFSHVGDKNLLRILDSFELLEKMEVNRLERCLQSSMGNEANEEAQQNNQTVVRAHREPMARRIYSFRQLQRQFRPNRHDYDSDNDSYHQPENCKLKMDIHEEIHDGQNIEILSKLKHANNEIMSRAAKNGETLNGYKSGSHMLSVENHPTGCSAKEEFDVKIDEDEDEDEVAETPLDDYLMTRGIQSFTKNRYSNILPYEHSRVKLEPSPVWPDSSGKTLSKKSSSGSSASNSVIRKRRNSYFSQDFRPKERESDSIDSQSSNKPSTTQSFNSPSNQLKGNSAENDSFNDYFNANYLKIPQINPDYNYIATQAPLPSTLDDFWKVVISNGVRVIISLNSDDELSMRKWDIYWNCKTLKKFDVQVKQSYDNVGGVKGCILRVFNVQRKLEDMLEKPVADAANKCEGSDSKYDFGVLKRKKTAPGEQEDHTDEPLKSGSYTVYQLQYTKWLDSCGIVMADVLKLHRMKALLQKRPEEFLENLEHGKAYHDIMRNDSTVCLQESKSDTDLKSQQSPVLVHCSAGCGRTGVFITLDFLLSVLESPFDKSNRIDVWNMSQDLIFIIVNELRKQRISMVQNLTQYITCYEGILEYFALRKNVDVNKLVC